MNIANRLTILRIFLVFPAVFCVLYSPLPYRWFCCFMVFILASFTDFLDGKIARKMNYITDFGKIMDPLADKILIISMLICFVGLKMIPILPVVLIVMREFIITSVRFLIIEKSNKVIAANIFGKLKTISQIIAISAIILFQVYIEIFGSINSGIVINTSGILMWISCVFSVLSGVIYIWENRKLLILN